MENTKVTQVSASFSALTLLVGQQEGNLACKKTEWWAAGVVICLEPGADLHMAQLMPLPLTVSCFSKIQIGFYLSGTGLPRLSWKKGQHPTNSQSTEGNTSST